MTSAPLQLLIDSDIESRTARSAPAEVPLHDENRDMKILFALLLCTMPISILPSAAFACMVTSDCEAGSRCVKPGGGLYGVCRGGRSPGNANDKQPLRTPSVLDLNGTYGNTCRFDIDCGMSSKCVRRRSGSLGTCVGG